MPTIAPGIGVRRHHVTLDTLGPRVPDGDGGYVETWVPLDPPDLWASITPASASDLQQIVSGTVVATATHVLTMPYHPGITLNTRITRPGHVYFVNFARNLDERNIELQVVVTEQVANANTRQRGAA